MNYTKELVAVSLKTIPTTFANFRPVDLMAYQNIDEQFKQRPVFDLWEGAVNNGQGWIAIVDEQGDLEVKGEFYTYLHLGSYEGLAQACQKLFSSIADQLDVMYCIYLNSPLEVEPEALKTKIIFKLNE